MRVLRSDNGRRPLVIAHRGNPVRYPENSLPGFRDAHRLGADLLETDVCMTRDGELVLSHDEVVSLGGEEVEISGLRLDEFLELDISENYREAGRYTGPELHPLTLEEFFESFPSSSFNLDLKQKSRRAVEELVRVVRSHGVQERAVIGSFHTENLRLIRELLPEAVTPATRGEVIDLLVRRWVHLPLGSTKFRCVQVPPRRYGITLVSEGIVQLLHRHGVGVHVWTINDVSEMEYFIEMGVDGIFTDDPQQLIALIQEREIDKFH